MSLRFVSTILILIAFGHPYNGCDILAFLQKIAMLDVVPQVLDKLSIWVVCDDDFTRPSDRAD